jgi:hypothetical protein
LIFHNVEVSFDDDEVSCLTCVITGKFSPLIFHDYEDSDGVQSSDHFKHVFGSIRAILADIEPFERLTKCTYEAHMAVAVPVVVAVAVAVVTRQAK